MQFVPEIRLVRVSGRFCSVKSYGRKARKVCANIDGVSSYLLTGLPGVVRQKREQILSYCGMLCSEP